MIASQPATEGGHLKLKGIRNQVADGDKIAREGERGQGCDRDVRNDRNLSP